MDDKAAEIHNANEAERKDIAERMGRSFDEQDDESWPSEILDDPDHVVRKQTRFITRIHAGAYDVADPFSVDGQLEMDGGEIHTETVGRDIAVEKMSEKRVSAFERKLK